MTHYLGTYGSRRVRRAALLGAIPPFLLKTDDIPEGVDRQADPALVVSTDWGGEQGAAAMANLLTLRHQPTAVYVHSDEVAIGAMRTIRRAGLRVPEDISVVGIDDHPMAALTDLTTIAQPVVEQGRAAAELTLALLRDDPAPINRAITLPTHLVVRRSTAPPRTHHP